MALFEENTTIVPTRSRVRGSRPRGTVVGIWALTLALVALLALTFLPSSYVIQQPGPVFNTLGSTTTADGDEVPLISVADAQTYPTAGALDLLTVQVRGNRERTPSWFDLVVAWFNPANAVVPLDQVYPPGVSTEDRDQANAEMMVDSQQEATAAALTSLGYEVNAAVEVQDVAEGSPAAGILQKGDVIVSADGVAISDPGQLREVIADGDGADVQLVFTRDGAEHTETVTPAEATEQGNTVWRIGVTIMSRFAFPFEVTIQLNNVGGPSAGMMFALGIIDTLSPGELNGGKNVAGTGTIDAAGTVGAIGGIRQKLYGAKDAGADYFLAPAANCDEVVGHVPSGLRVFSVSSLDDALAVLTALRDDGDLDALPTCTATIAAAASPASTQVPAA